MNENKSIFETLFEINVNDHIEKKKDLTYLSWPYAWAAVKKKYPTATYKIHQFGEKQLPYVFDEGVGYMVFTSVTIENLTHTMCLPVIDSANKAMKSEGYTYDTKFRKDISVESATMFDVNKTIMRCLVKNLAMFILGLYIYSGEDLPEIELEKITAKDANILKNTVRSFDDNSQIYEMILKKYKVKSFKELTPKQRVETLEGLQEMRLKMEIKFTVPGNPKGKQRPRMCRINSRKITYTPKQTTQYEKLVRASYTAVSKIFFEKNTPLIISIIALFSIPKSVSKKLKNSMLKGDILPTKKPDSDNIIKIILDALNGACYHDDAQICSIHFKKKYAEIPAIQITIKEIEL